MKKIILFLLATVFASVLCFGGCSTQNNSGSATSDKSSENNIKNGEELLFSFENYDSVHHTVKELGNKFGIVSVSDQHATEGSSSAKLEICGKYSYSSLPYMKIYCSESDFKNPDFSWFESVKFDIYNANDTQMSIRVKLNVSMIGNSALAVDTEKQTYVLNANSSTTVEYEIPEIQSVFDLEMVNYIYVEFLEIKEDADDDMNVFYIDYMRGKLTDTQKISDGKETLSFKDGVTFETYIEGLLLVGFQGMEFSRETYEDMGVSDIDGVDCGEHLLCGANSGRASWPGFLINFGESFEIGAELKFYAYIDTYGEAVSKVFRIEAYSDTGKSAMFGTSYQRVYNNWFEVTITFTMKSDSIWVFFNMRDDSTLTHIISGNYAFYFDNFIIE